MVITEVFQCFVLKAIFQHLSPSQKIFLPYLFSKSGAFYFETKIGYFKNNNFLLLFFIIHWVKPAEPSQPIFIMQTLLMGACWRHWLAVNKRLISALSEEIHKLPALGFRTNLRCRQKESFNCSVERGNQENAFKFDFGFFRNIASQFESSFISLMYGANDSSGNIRWNLQK